MTLLVEETGPARPYRVLVVDDDSAILRMIQRLLEFEGFEVVPAQDGVQALELLDDDLDAAVLDLQMPRMDGRTLYARIRDLGHRMPVLVLSAYGAQTAADELGAEAGMSKPFDIDQFVEQLRELIEGPAIAEERPSA